VYGGDGYTCVSFKRIAKDAVQRLTETTKSKDRELEKGKN